MKFLSHLFIFSTIILAINAKANDLIEPDALIQKMTLRQKIAQLIIIAAVSNEILNKDFMSLSPYPLSNDYVEELINVHQVGGVLFLGAGFTHEQAATTKRFQALSPHIPLLVTLDAEWGLAMRLYNGFRFPFNMTLGALNENDLIYQMGYQIGLELAEIGVHMNLGPVIDVNNNPNNPVINHRSFGSDPNRVAAKGAAYIKGLQDAGIAACAKHFPGHGDTDIDSHKALPLIAHSKARLHEIELVPFQEAIAQGVKSVMIGHLEVPALEPEKALPATLSKNIITNLLRKELNFDGLIITDGLGMQGITNNHQPGELEVRSLEAGADMLLAPVDPKKAIDAIENAVKSGRISEQSINEKVRRVLIVKQWTFARKAHQPADKKNAMKIKKDIFAQAVTVAKDTLDPNRDLVNDALISITGMHPFKQHQFGLTNEKILEIAKLKTEEKKVTVILYGSPYAAEIVEGADRIIIAYEDDGAAHEAVQQILAGFKQAKGKLPV